MRTIGSQVDFDSRPRTSVLIFLMFVVVSPILASKNTHDDERGHEYSRETQDTSEFSKNSKESKMRSRGGHDEDSRVGSDRDHVKQSSNTNGDGSALSRFLENVLRAQDDLKWIDEAVRGINREKDWEKSAHANEHPEAARLERASSTANVGHGNKLREKRGFDRNYEAMWTNKKKHGDENPSELPQRVYLDSDMLKRDAYLEDLDFPRNSMNEKNVRSRDDQIPKGLTRTEDLCSLSDWLNKNSESDHEEKTSHKTAGFNVKNQQDDAKKDGVPSLEALKETVLELKKSLYEADKRQREASKNVNSSKIKEKERVKEEWKERDTRGKNTHEGNENENADSNWWDGSGLEASDLKKREQSGEDLGDKNSLRVWRTKRTEVNNDEANPKLFHGSGSGKAEEERLKELHDRKRRSKGTPSDEKRHLNEPGSQNRLGAEERNSIKTSNEETCNEADDADKREPSDVRRGSNTPEQLNKLTDDVRDSLKKTLQVREEGKSPARGENYEQSDLSRAKPNAMESMLMKNEEKSENLEGNSVRTFGSVRNELQPISTEISTLNGGRVVVDDGARKTERNEENVGSSNGEQVIKVFEPEGHRNGERIKESERLESDEDSGKLSERLSQEKRSTEESGNINILLRSENKNLIKLSNAPAGREGSSRDERGPFMVNRFDVKKKLIVEDEEKAGKSVSTIFNMKIEKARVDAPVKTLGKQSEGTGGGGAPFLNDVFDPGKNKANEEVYEEPAGFTNDLKQRNVDEEGVKNSAEFNKGSVQSDENEGPRNWHEGVPRNQMGLNIDETAEGRYKEGCEEKSRNEDERFREDKKRGESVDDSNGASSVLRDKIKEHQPTNGKRYNEIVIPIEGAADRKMNERYVRRRVLQYMEYSNDDVEDADSSYSDKEEEADHRAEEGDASAHRKDRSALNDKGNPVKAKLNVLIKEKLDKKKKANRGNKRKRRNPANVIEYYDYDSENEQRDADVLSAANEQQRIKTNYDQSAEANAGLEEKVEGDQACVPLGKKTNEHEKEMLKQERQKEMLKNKQPKEEFIVHVDQPKNETEKPSQPTEPSGLLKFAEEEGSSGNQHPGRLSQSIEEKEDRCSEGGSKDISMLNPANYILTVDKNSDSGSIDDLLENMESMDQTNGKLSSDIQPLYDELKKLYDWSDDESKNKLRLKGDQRMYYSGNDKLDATNADGERIKDHPDPPQIESPSKMSDSSPNLLPLLLVRNGSADSEMKETSSSEDRGASKLSQSDYFALKSTDDMFKGGPEQSNSTEEKLRGASSIVTAGEWQTQKVNGAGNREKDASRSLTDHGQYIDTDSRSPYENGEYFATRNTDRDRRTVISSRDLHESFVEPFDWIDDFDNDIRVRLSRGLKTVQDAVPNVASNFTTQNEIRETKLLSSVSEENPISTSSKISEVKDSTEKTAKSGRSVSLSTNVIRVRRDLADPYDTFYDDMNEHQRDSEKVDYNRYLKNSETMDNRVQLLNSYGSSDDIRQKLSKSKEETEEDDSLDDSEDSDTKKVARSANSKKKHKKRKKHHGGTSKKHKRKGHDEKSKHSDNHRKRRHRKKHANDSKTKKHDRKKQKKRTSKSADHRKVKKHEAGENERKVHGPSVSKRKRHHKENENTINSDSESQGKRISPLLAADHMEDESQMDSALHGELAGKIVEQIFEQVQKNENVKVSLGPGLYKKHKTEDTVTADKTYRQALNDDEIRHTEELLQKVMLLLNRLIFDEVQRKTCVSLPPDLIEFLDWMLNVNPEKTSLEQMPSLPLVHTEDTPERFPKDKFLFQDIPDRETKAELGELYKKLRLMKSLIEEYGALSAKEKTKVQSVHDYLAKQLDLLLEYIAAKEAAEKKGKSFGIGAAAGKNEGILQYQIGMTNATNRTYPLSTDAFSPLMNAPDILRSSNASYHPEPAYFHGNGIDYDRKKRRIIRSVDKTRHKEQKKGKQRKRKHRKRHKGASTIDQRRKGLVHKAAALRQKRGYLDKDFWDSFDPGYEEPLIYTFVDAADGGSTENGDGVDVKTKGNGRYPKDVFLEAVNKIDSNLRNLFKKRDARGTTTNLNASMSASRKDVEKSLSNSKENNLREDSKNLLEKEEQAITGKNRVEDEVILLNKRQAWKKENEEQLEEVAFGEDMRKGLKEKELFEKLTEIDKEKSESTSKNEKTGETGVHELKTKGMQNVSEECNRIDGMCDDLSDEEKLRMLEKKINVYSDDD